MIKLVTMKTIEYLYEEIDVTMAKRYIKYLIIIQDY